MSEVKETTFLVQHESCECKCRFNESVCNLKPKQKHNECWCECKGLDGWVSCKNDNMSNPNTCDCECNKAYKIDEYLDNKNCFFFFENCLIGKLVLKF